MSANSFNLNNALNLAIAAYAGYELGKVIFEQFESARKAGLALAEAAILTGEEIRYAFDFSKDAQKDHLKRLDDIEANLQRAAVDQLTDSLKRQAREALDPLADAYKTLGLVSSATLKDQADAARKAYDALLAGNAPLHDQIAAYTAMAEKVLTAAKAQNSYALAQAEGALRAEVRNQKEADALQTIIQKLADANKNAKALGQSMDEVYEKTREARIEAESLANARDRINNLGDVSASVVSLNDLDLARASHCGFLGSNAAIHKSLTPSRHYAKRKAARNTRFSGNSL